MMEADQQSAGFDEVQRILEQRARKLARAMTSEEEHGQVLTVITFRLGSETYAADMSLLREVQPLAGLNWSPLPCTPDFILGLTNLRGRLYSLVDLGVFLGLTKRPISESAHVILLKAKQNHHHGEISLAVLVDSLPMVRRLDADELKQTGEGMVIKEREFVQGVTSDLVILLDLKNLLSDPRMVVDSDQAGSEG